MGAIAMAILVILAFLIGLGGQFVGRARFELEWLVAMGAAVAGGYAASEHLGALGAWGPQVDGMFVLPALVGALALAALADAAARATGDAGA